MSPVKISPEMYPLIAWLLERGLMVQLDLSSGDIPDEELEFSLSGPREARMEMLTLLSPMGDDRPEMEALKGFEIYILPRPVAIGGIPFYAFCMGKEKKRILAHLD